MSTRKLIEALDALPEPLTQRHAVRAMVRVMMPRLIVGVLLLIAWTWVRWQYVDLRSQVIEEIVETAVTALLFIAVGWPLIRLSRMSDAEWNAISARNRQRKR
jgi:hypothetical protein